VGPAYRPWQASREVRFGVGDDDARAERGSKGEHVQLGLTMGYKFCTIRFKDRSGLGSGSIYSHF
jgi:hypothetical protein